MAEEKPRQFVGSTEFKKGLEGAITNESKISYVDGANGKLIYCGYSIDDLTQGGQGFEETGYLLLHGRLPKRAEFDAFKKEPRRKADHPRGGKGLPQRRRQEVPPHEQPAVGDLPSRLSESE